MLLARKGIETTPHQCDIATSLYHSFICYTITTVAQGISVVYPLLSAL